MIWTVQEGIRTPLKTIGLKTEQEEFIFQDNKKISLRSRES